MKQIPDHPVIANLIHTGYPDGREPTYPHCPICGEECDTIYKNNHDNVFACNCCVVIKDAWDTDECFPRKE